jgi:hypothetical protein
MEYGVEAMTCNAVTLHAPALSLAIAIAFRLLPIPDDPFFLLNKP